MEKTNAAPTGCYKCGRPGHWSRDCPDSNPNPNPNPSSNPNSPRSFPSNNNSSSNNSNYFSGSNSKPAKAAEKPKKVPRSRPKLTPELLLGEDNGLGFILRHFPRNFKYRGRGHEVSDLGNLIGLYSEWHSHLLPYYSFDQFVHKVEQVAATKRAKMCVRELRERVASGGDPTKLRESLTEHVSANVEHDLSTPDEGLNSEVTHNEEDPLSKNQDVDGLPEDMLHEVYDRATEEPTQTLVRRDMELPNEINGASCSNEVSISEEQKARMEANRLRALERAAARAQS